VHIDLDDALQTNRISASISEDTIQEIQLGLDKIRERLPFLVRFLEDNRPYLLEIGEHLRPFMEQSLVDAKAHPNLVPPFLDIEELERDLNLFAQLLQLLKPMEELTSLLHDTAMAAGSDAFETAVVFYKRARMGAKLGDPEATEVTLHILEKMPEIRQGGGRIKVS
jgi:hypothetical protein